MGKQLVLQQEFLKGYLQNPVVVHTEDFMGKSFNVLEIPYSMIPGGNPSHLREAVRSTSYFMQNLDNSSYLCLNKEVLRKFIIGSK